MDVSCNSQSNKSRPWNAQFISSWIFIVFSGPFYYFLYDPFFSLLAVRVVLTVAVSALWILLIVTGIFLVFSNPSDIRLVIKSSSTLDCRYCLVCKANVHQDSLHCKYCNKCVYRLDHHCFYINNCIGRSNYKLYILSMILLFSFSLINSCISLYVFSTYWIDYEFYEKISKSKNLRIETLYHVDSNLIISLVVVFTVLNTLVWTYISYLLHFHYILSNFRV